MFAIVSCGCHFFRKDSWTIGLLSHFFGQDPKLGYPLLTRSLPPSFAPVQLAREGRGEAHGGAPCTKGADGLHMGEAFGAGAQACQLHLIDF